MIDFINFNDRYKQLRTLLPHANNVAEYLIAGLNIRIFEPASAVEDVLIVYHGGGVNSDAGYDILAHQISHRGSICTCLIDIRGHGRSLGNKGSVSNPKQVWQDIDTVLENVRVKFPRARVHLLGHSSGGGMLINYFTRFTPSQQSDSLILLAPEFGPFAPAKICRRSMVPFASVSKWPFVLNTLSVGLLCGNRYAVTLNFPNEVMLLRPEFVQRYSVNMANALTPRQPARQIAALPLPVTVLIAEKDELFDARQMSEFVEGCGNPNLHSRIIEHSKHLDCIFDISEEILQHLNRCSSN
ncbi:TPA: alpha/beta hydrolase [Citrobacter farmeri]|uniref:alpha/beta hydrolase n=1 Tax=Citrobacter farmeri TaxID=67824 RepID=UPI00189E758E|nr:alpha/beta hydrolase [Citrobacter farmeri]EHK0943487.1 alpha/beta hydrolase [Citrobacter farmeri]EKX4538843.1 alpha/beta hydrolase [Citrobacter farmeri]MDB2164804.1 alpha/beta hydrolase [Citrobacter farmeri]HBC0356486.1 alpha/beta hydrolase [Citrobacter farmeri]HBZ8832820.1 alpha/beta hydrolase [Citrobacter farmeri]